MGYAKIIADKHEDVMVKLGAIFAQGIIDAGGRNVTVSLQSRTGHTNMMAVVGMLVFTQYWYWFPLTHFLSLAFTPSALIGLNKDLDMPVISFKSNAKPAVYGYPPALEEKKKEAGEKVATAVLSITAKQKRKEKEAEKKKEKESNKMEVDENVKDEKSEKDKKEEKSEDKDKKDEKDEKKDAEKEVKKEDLTFDTLANPARVIKPQLKVVSVDKDSSQYRPIKDVVIGGIVMMKNTS